MSDVASRPSCSDPRQQLGLDGEQCAVETLIALGYVILARRYRTRFGELDIVARDGTTLVFVEVKARRGVAFGQPEDAVHWRKRQRLARLAEAFLAEARLLDVPCRFDVVAIVWHDGRAPDVQVFRHAFDVETR
jgi:putative endonuclease